MVMLASELYPQFDGESGWIPLKGWIELDPEFSRFRVCQRKTVWPSGESYVYLRRGEGWWRSPLQ